MREHWTALAMSVVNPSADCSGKGTEVKGRSPVMSLALTAAKSVVSR